MNKIFVAAFVFLAMTVAANAAWTVAAVGEQCNAVVAYPDGTIVELINDRTTTSLSISNPNWNADNLGEGIFIFRGKTGEERGKVETQFPEETGRYWFVDLNHVFLANWLGRAELEIRWDNGQGLRIGLQGTTKAYAEIEDCVSRL